MLNIHNILVPTDYSECADRAYSHAAALAERFGARVHLLHVRLADEPRTLYAPPLPPSSPARILPPVRVEVAAASASDAIVRYAAAHDVDLIVMGARGLGGLRPPQMGGVARRVLRNAPCAVLAVRQPFPAHGLRRVLAPVDFSRPAAAALAVAKGLAAAFGAEVEALHVIAGLHGRRAAGFLPTSPLPPPIARRWEHTLRDFATRAGGPDVPLQARVTLGPPAPTVVNTALQRQADLVVLGTHGKTGPRAGEVGGVAEGVAFYAPCATLAVRPSARPLLQPSTTAEMGGERRRRSPFTARSAREGSGTPR